MKKNYLLFLIYLAFAWLPLYGQLNFINSNDLIDGIPAHSGAPIGVLDVNGDGYDDIVRLNNVSEVSVVYQMPDSLVYPVYDLPSNQVNGSWSVCAADLNNDGASEILTGGAYTGIAYLLADPQNLGDYSSSFLTSSNVIFLQASNMADINNDGWLDYFGCHDDGPSRIWGNDQTGDLFFTDADWIDLSKFPTVEQNSGNYGSVWTDFDSDGDLDLYIAKCRQNVTGFTDPRRVNQLWENDGQNNYSETAADYNLAIGAQSWTGDFADIDNDGDFDCLITNHDVISQLLENDGTGRFTDITQQAGVNITGLAIQGIMQDFDNDGFVDILVSGSSGQLFHNNGDNTFTEVDAGITGDLHSFAIGDLNYDGFLDFYGGYGFGFNTPTIEDDILWMNEGNDNHYLAVHLEGTVSNRPAVGARVELFGPWGVMVREVRAGESYGIVNTLTPHFGLGDEENPGQLVIRWPSGRVTILEEPPVDTFLTFVEPDCSPTPPVISSSGEMTLCPGETLDLTVPAGWEVLWSNGASGNTLTVDAPGTYLAYATDTSGCTVLSNAVKVRTYLEPEPEIALSGPTDICEGETLTLTANEALAYLWSTGDTTQSISVGTAGVYSVVLTGNCDDYPSDNIEVEVYQALAPFNTEGDTLPGAGNALLSAEGDSLLWYQNETGGAPLGGGSFFETPIIDETTSFYVENLSIFDGLQGKAGQTGHTGPSFFNGDTYNGNLTFEVLSPMVWKSVKTFTDTPGKRELQVRTSNNLLLASRDLQIDDPVTDTLFMLDIYLEPGEYSVTTNQSVNNNELGHPSPRLYRSNEGVQYPYTLEGVVSLTGSDAGGQFYYYFYDWEVEQQTVCRSERVEVIAVVDSALNINGLEEQSAIRVYPNPVGSSLQVEASESGPVKWIMFNAQGQMVLSKEKVWEKEEVFSINTSSLPVGVYWLQVFQNNRQGLHKIIKNE
jgi:hypothetical protein